MADVFSRKVRSEIMKRVRRSRTFDENALVRELRRLGVRVGRNVATLPGTPDVVLRGCRLAVFVDGDFWHGRAWFEQGRAPATNSSFWIERFESNRLRDRRVDRQLRVAGWKVVRVWGSDIRRDAASVAKRIVRRRV